MFRTVLFWLHLAAGVVAGIVILVMSATGVALTYERQLNAWTTGHLRSQPSTPDAVPLPLETVLARASANRSDFTPVGVTVAADREAAVVVMGEPSPIYVDAFSGRELGHRRGAGLREFLSTMRAWHRWLAIEGENRAIARAITGWSNFLFLFIVVSGAYLWLPRTWRWVQFKQILWFKRRYGTSKARDFNWHHVIGIWSLVPLFFVVLGAVPISFPWANDIVYRVVGEEPPVRGRPGGPAGPGGPGGPGRPESQRGPGRASGPGGREGSEAAALRVGAAGEPRQAVGRRGSSRLGGPLQNADAISGERQLSSYDGLNVAFARASAEAVDWRTISVRFPRRHEEPLSFSIDRGDGGQPQLRSTITVTRTGEVVSRETFADQSTGRQVRSFLRFAHTGEVFGLTGQTIAGIASAGAVLMVWTGLALSWRRLIAWRRRRSAEGAACEPAAAFVTASAAQHTSQVSLQESISMKRRSSAPNPLRRLLTRRSRLFMLGAATIAPAASAHGGQAPEAPVTQPSADAERLRSVTFTFSIPAGTIESVVRAFERVTSLRVAIANPELGTLESPGVHGVMTVESAIRELLAGTAVEPAFHDDHVEIVLARLSEDVRVVGRLAQPTVSSPRYTVPLRDVAQTIALVPRTVMDQRAAATLTDVLRNVPGITLQAGEGGGASSTAGDMFNMRGFSANNSLFVDNVRDSGLIARDIFNVEQVEVFMGPTGSDVGRGNAAGYVNMASKRPHLGRTTEVMATAGTANQGRVTADVNWSGMPDANAGWWAHSGFRLNALWQDRGVAGRDYVKNSSTGLAPSLALGLGTPTRVFASAQIVRQDNLPDYGIPTAGWTESQLAPTVVQASRSVRQANYYGSPVYDYDRAEQNAGFLRVEHDVRRNVTLSNQTRVNRTHRDAIVSAIQNVAAYAPTTETVTIARQGNERENRIVSNQTTLVSRFATGALRHGFSGGMELLREDQGAPGKQGMGTRAAVSLYTPNPADIVADYSPSRSLANTDGSTDSVAVYANDTMEVGTRWLLAGGFRVEQFDTTYKAVDAAAVTTADLTADGTLTSGRASVLFRLNSASNVYVSYGTTVTPPGEANFQLSATANNVNNPNLEPQRSANLEAGAKIDLHGGRLALTGSVFRTRNKNVIYTIDATAIPPLFNQDDDQLVRGASVGALGQITDRWQVLANASYLDATLQSQGVNNGTRLPLTPAFSGSVWSTVRVARSLSVGGGVQYVGSAFVNNVNTIRVPSRSVLDGLVEYNVNTNLTLRLNVNNLTDAVYVKSVNNNGGRYNLGERRSLLATTSVKF